MIPPARTPTELGVQLTKLGWSDDDNARARAAIDAAIELHAGQFRATGRPFLNHVIGTASILADSGSETDLTIAAILHGAYELGTFPDGGLGMTSSNRRWISAHAGEDVEALVAAYSRFNPTREIIESFGVRSVPLGDQDRRMLAMRTANEIDDQLDGESTLTPKGSGWLLSRDGVNALSDAAGRAGLSELADGLRAARQHAEALEVSPAFRTDKLEAYLVPHPIARFGDIPWWRLASHSARRARSLPGRIRAKVAVRTRLRAVLKR
jgi:HD domain